ncbi:MAG TPA: hypothetical protein VG755_20595 [Nannocystaceae bacterium]|nr:hypothetical protein [Nannocystaceae bacterium]
MLPRTAAVLAIALAAACDRGEPEYEYRGVDVIVADRSAHAVSNNTNLAGIAELLFSADPSLQGATSIDDAKSLAVLSLVVRLGAINFKDCTPQITYDMTAGTVDAIFDGCRVGLLKVDGDSHATVEIEREACETGECPAAVLWTLHDFDVLIGPNESKPHFAGDVLLRDAIQAPGELEEPMSWQTLPGFTITNALGVFETSSHASWTVDDDRCVDMQMESLLERIDDDDPDRERKIQTIVVGVEGLHRCPLRCPSDGRVRISFGTGALLDWTYEDGGQVEVKAPRGRTFVHQLVCAE